jgi:hypothetical protein
MISRSVGTQFAVTISGSASTLFALGIPCVTRNSVFADDFWVSSDTVFGDNFRVRRDVVFAEASMRHL